MTKESPADSAEPAASSTATERYREARDSLLALREDRDRAVAEFFVVRKHRRRGVGLAAAHALFGSAWGVWEAAVVRRNAGALAFWRQAASTYPGVRDVVEEDRHDARWDGAVLRFRVG